MVRVLIPSGALGLNYDKVALERGIAAKPDIIAIDGGSTDSGPAYLGQGVSKYARESTKREWKGLMEARAKAGVPLVLGTSGTCGTDSAVEWMLDMTRAIADELGQSVKIAVLRCSQNAERLRSSFSRNRIAPLSGAPDITIDTFSACTNIVALAGAEQINAALQTGADIILAGRTTDTAIIAALPLARGCHAGAAWHGAKIGECGALCASNPQSGVILVDFDEAGFTITPLADGAHATPHTVSAHMLYENSDPFILYEPGGHLDVTGAEYTALDDTRVRVVGSKWVPSDRYTVKLEGTVIEGYQSVLLSTIRDPRYVQNAPAWAADVQAECRAKVMDRLELQSENFQIEVRLIGIDATLGGLEADGPRPREVGAMGIVTAATQELASDIAKILDPYLLHHPLTPDEEQPSFAFPFSPVELRRGALYNFALNHVLTLEDPMDAFSLEVVHSVANP